MQTVVLVGAGNMGFAMLSGWLRGNLPSSVYVVDPNSEFRIRAEQTGARSFTSIEDLPNNLHADLVIVAVKPQLVSEVILACAQLAKSGAAFLSVAAGVRIQALRSSLPRQNTVIRCMPNTSATIGEGVMALYSDAAVPPPVLDLVRDLLSSCGVVTWVSEEDEMDAVTAISGSGPAYVFLFIEALTSAGMKLGLSAETALLLAKQTIAGAGLMARQSSLSPTTLREQVTSPNGTTAAALSIFMKDDALVRLTEQAAYAARDRSVQLSQQT